MSESAFLLEFNQAGNPFNHWVFATLVIGSFIVFLFSIVLSIVKNSVNRERHILMSMSIIVIVFTMLTYMFLVIHFENKMIDRYTKSLDYNKVVVDNIEYGEYVTFSYTDNEGTVVNKKIDKRFVDFVRDLKNGEPVRVDFKEINIKTIKAEEAPNGLYDVKVHVDNEFKEE